jgi:alpha-1,6-mannosyltransferase
LPIKTLHITNSYHATSGGIRTFYHALLTAANAHRRHLRLVVPGPKDSMEEIGEFGRIYCIQAPRSPFIDSAYRLLLPHLYAMPYRSRLHEILEEERPDLVEICDKYTLCFLPTAWRKGWIEDAPETLFVGLSCERMDDNVAAFLSQSMLGRRFANWYMRAIYAPRFDEHISNSEYTAGELTAALSSRPDLPVQVCPMGADCGNFGPHRRDKIKRRALLDTFHDLPANAENTRLLLYVGRLSPEKNISLLLDVMEILARKSGDDYRLLILGKGQLAHWVQTNANRRAAGRVRLAGYVSDREGVADVLANCDAMIHPNPREPFGIAPLEAMASGLPVVAPLSGGVLSYANQSNAWLAEPNGASFAKAVQNIFEDDAARLRKIDRAMNTAHEFSWDKTASRFFELYDAMHARHRSSKSESPQAAAGTTSEIIFGTD